MKIKPECVPCLLKRIIFEAEQSTTNKTLHTRVIQNACKRLAELYDPSTSSASIATQVHKTVYETLGDTDPYNALKQQSNTIAQSLLPKVEELLKHSKQPLKTSILCSIIGNIMDFGIDGSGKHPETLRENFEHLLSEGLGIDEYTIFESLLKKAHRVVLFTDNCGEIVFDKILCREIKKVIPLLRVTVVVKGEPIISDATLEDATQFRFADVVDQVLTTGGFSIGVDFVHLPDLLKKELDTADLIICKGMANYEAFSETSYQPIAYLLRTKCGPIARSMGLPLGINVLKVYQ